MRKIALLVPTYKPTEATFAFLRRFAKGDFDYFLLIDDGSGLSREAALQKALETTPFEVAAYPDHKGRGYALRSGMSILLSRHRDIDVIVTAEADGTYSYEDVLKIRDHALENPDALVLGYRPNEEKPNRTRLAKKVLAIKDKIASKRAVKDPRCGLRAVPFGLFALALATRGNRYQYETDFLEEAVRRVEVVQVEVRRNKVEPNPSFNPILDNLLIYRRVILYVLASLTSWVIDLGLFAFLSTYVFTQNAETQVYLSTILARVVSGFANFLLLFLFVFDKREGFGSKMAKYGVLFLVNLGLSSSLTYAFKFVPASLTFVKFVVDAAISIANYFVNKLWVFSKKKRKPKTSSKSTFLNKDRSVSL